MQVRSPARHGQLLTASLTLGALALIAVTGWYYLRQRAAMEAAARQELLSVVEIKVQQIASWRSERIANGRILASSSILRIAEHALSGAAIDSTIRADLLAAIQEFEREFPYTGAALVDRNGTIRLVSSTVASDTSRISELGRAAAQEKDVNFSDFYWDAKLGRPLMALSVPVQRSGALIFTIDPERFLYPFIRPWPVPSRTATMALGRIEGTDAVTLSDLPGRPGSALHYRRPLSDFGDREVLHSLKPSSIDDVPDYRGVPVLRVVQRIPDSPWYLLAKIDVSEIDSPVRRLGGEMAAIVALIALANITAVGFFWRSQQIRYYRESEQRMRQVANETPAYLWMSGIDGENTFINRPLAQFLGANREHLGKDWKSYFHPDDVERVTEKYFRCVALRGECSDEARLRRCDGEYRWFAGTAQPRFSRQGEFLGYAGSFLDVTERRAADDRARENAELVRGQNRILELIAQNAPLGEILNCLVSEIESLVPEMLGSILLLDPDGLHLRHGAAPHLPAAYVQAIDGEPIGPKAGSCGAAAFRRELVIVEHIATDPLWENYREIALSSGLRACWSTPIVEEKGPNERNVLGTFAFYFRSPGRPTPRHEQLIEIANQTAAIAICRARESEALRTSEERLRLATICGNLGIWEWQLDPGRLIWSEGLTAMFGLPQGHKDVTRKNFFDAIHPADRDYVEEALELALEKHVDYDAEYRVCLPDGTLRWIASHGRAQYGPDGTPLRILGTARDITLRKEAEIKLQCANTALAEELQERARNEKEIQALSARLINAQEEERTRLARELHDDLSQQIASLGISVSNLKREIPPESTGARSQTERIGNKLAHLGEGVRRLSHNLHPAILEHSGLVATLRSYCSEFSAFSRTQVAFRSDRLSVDVDPAIALCAYRITQEALQNVVKHAQTDKAEVVLTESGDELILTISDRGIGMDGNRFGSSMGLGLTSIRERARLVNGKVDIQSQPSRGTTLKVTLPR